MQGGKLPPTHQKTSNPVLSITLPVSNLKPLFYPKILKFFWANKTLTKPHTDNYE